MNYFCAVGLHSWGGCSCTKCGLRRNKNHNWNNSCTCIKCGTKRDEKHDWDRCTCQNCGHIRNQFHEWNGCKCMKCNTTQHKWIKIGSQTYDESCSSCGGAGWYADTGSPVCGACNGRGTWETQSSVYECEISKVRKTE